MPYCPKCDMEFVEGVTVCTDCGGPLVSSKEEYERMKKEEEEDAKKALGMELKENEDLSKAIPAAQIRRRPAPRNDVYVSKAERYEDYSSSATAFIIVGIAALAVSILGFTGILPLPFYGMFRTIMLLLITAIGVACLVVSIHSFHVAGSMKGEIAEEKEATTGLTNWFTENFTADGLDSQIDAENGDGLKPEERALKRLSLIQDILITNYDILDQTYADELAEEIYDLMFDD